MKLQLNHFTIIKLVIVSIASLTMTLTNLGDSILVPVLGQFTYPFPLVHSEILREYHHVLDDQISSYDITNDSTGDEISDVPDLPGQQIKFERISVEHGLSQSSISSIYQDRKGFL